MLKRFQLIFISVLLTLNSLAHTPKERSSVPLYKKRELKAIKAEDKFVINGVLDEETWQKAATAKEFTTYSPSIGDPAKNRTEVKMSFDQKAIYFAATLYRDKSTAMTSLSKRDEFPSNSDYFYIVISPFNDNQNYFKFRITSANVQSDAIISTIGTDYSWDAVWDSETKHHKDCWTIEISIPYSALRFPKEQVENWGINFFREDRGTREISTWNPVDRGLSSWISQSGLLSGIYVEKPPKSLEIYPYISGGQVKQGDDKAWSYGGGLDLKYGINSSYTLAMTLVPDFSQTSSDNEVLNLTPYETVYGENRPFFIEGTELFTKTGTLYSRRIGKSPDKYDEVDDTLQESEEVETNPSTTKLINAIKLSGRGQDGTAIGVLNAMTSETKATVKDTITDDSRQIITQGFTNYNLLVYDKIFKKYSYVNISNSNRTDFYHNKIDNVISGMIQYSGDKNRHSVALNGKFSSITEDDVDTQNGFYIATSYAKQTGNLRPYLFASVISDTYNINGMGYSALNNDIRYITKLTYYEFTPSEHLLSWSIFGQYHQIREYLDNKFVIQQARVQGSIKLQNNTSISGVVDYTLGETHNYKETRTEDQYVIEPNQGLFYTSISTNYAKRFALDCVGQLVFYQNRESEIGYKRDTHKYIKIVPRLRLNNKIKLTTTFESVTSNNEVGFVEKLESDTVVFGQRDNNNMTYSIDASYIFNNKMYLSLKARHYWSRVEYTDFFNLNGDGSLSTDSQYSYDNINYNALNLDLYYSWNFAPGSFMSVMWKQNLSGSTADMPSSFNSNLDTIKELSPTTTLSMKVSYYLDYNMLKSLFRI